MVNVLDLKEDGVDLRQMQVVIDDALKGLSGTSYSREKEVLVNLLRSLQDDCELNE